MAQALPDGATWFPRLAPALERASEGRGIAVCWEARGTRVFGVFASHTEMWAAVQRAPPPHCGYEIIRESDPCKAYADLEFYCPLAERDALAPAIDNALRVFLEHFRAMGGGGRLTVLDGTRAVSLPAAKAQEWFGVATEATDVDAVKFSYHVVVQGMAFANAGVVKQRVRKLPPFASLVADGSRLHALVARQPSLVDLSVYFKNKNFRMLGSCKASDTSTPLRFHATYNEHTEEIDALVTYAAHLPLAEGAAVSAIDQASHDRPKKRARVAAEPPAAVAAVSASHEDVQSIIRDNKERLDALQAALRALMVQYGDARTEVRYLVEVDGHSLRWELRNAGTRPCLLNCTDHHSNNALLWLIPILTGSSSDSFIRDGYEVKVQCTTERCGKPTGVIGRLAWNGQRYDVTVVFPPQLVPTSRRPGTFRPRTEPLPGAVVLMHTQQPQPQAQPSPQPQPVPARSEELVVVREPAPAGNGADEEDDVDVMDPEQNTYELVKTRFERFNFCVMYPFTYAYLRPGSKDIITCGDATWRSMHSNVYYYERDPFTRDWIKKRFVVRWMNDERRRKFDEIVVDPRSSNPRNYNMWPGIASARLPPVPAHLEVELAMPFVRHVHEVYANENAEISEYLLDVFANMLQRPERPSHVAISLLGTEGCGKGILLTHFREQVLGEELSYQSANAAQDLLSRFANGLANRVMVQVDEVSNMHEFHDLIKNLVTSPKVQLERKGKDVITIPNLVNLFFTSNNANTFKISPKDRRFVLLECSDRYCQNEDYMYNLLMHLQRPEAARALYQVLMRRDISKYKLNFQTHRPQTSYFLECQQMSLPTTSRFLSAISNSDECPTRIGAMALYSKYAAYHQAGQFKNAVTCNAFGRVMGRMGGVTKELTCKGAVYNIARDALREYLVQRKEYDADASLI